MGKIDRIGKEMFSTFRHYADMLQPNYNLNIYKIVPTLLRCLNYHGINRSTLVESSNASEKINWKELMDAQYACNIIVDGFGVNSLEKSNLFRKWFNNNGLILSTIHPSLTAPALASIHLGYPPEIHGIVGNEFYLSEITTHVNAVFASPSNTTLRDYLEYQGLDLLTFLWCKSLTNDFANAGGAHRYILYDDISKVGLFSWFTSNEERLGTYTLFDAYSQAERFLERYRTKKVLLNIHIGFVDYISHRYGPRARETLEAIKHIEDLTEKFLRNLPKRIREKMVLSICADHGQINLNKKKEIQFTSNDVKSLNTLLRFPIKPHGRIMRIYSKKNKTNRVETMLTEIVGDNAIVLSVEDLQKELLENSDGINSGFQERSGDLIVQFRKGSYATKERRIPQEGYTPSKKADHGGLSVDEQAVPLIIIRPSSLI